MKKKEIQEGKINKKEKTYIYIYIKQKIFILHDEKLLKYALIMV